MGKFTPIEELSLHEGVQKRFWFPNDYGASVVKHKYSYGSNEGLWEVAVLHYEDGKDGGTEIVYDTHITDDVIGRLEWEEVEKILLQISELATRVPEEAETK